VGINLIVILGLGRDTFDEIGTLNK
jgi:hypothetical protein